MALYPCIEIGEDGAPVQGGQQILVERPMAKGLRIGHTLHKMGKTFRRVPSIPEAAVQQNIHFKSSSLPDWYPYASRFNEKGRPLIDGMEEAKTIAKRASDAGEPMDYAY